MQSQPPLLSRILGGVLGRFIGPLRARVQRTLGAEPVALIGTVSAFVAGGLGATKLPPMIARPLQIAAMVGGLLAAREMVTPAPKVMAAAPAASSAAPSAAAPKSSGDELGDAVARTTRDLGGR
jgi:hypothetical protein